MLVARHNWKPRQFTMVEWVLCLLPFLLSFGTAFARFGLDF